MKYNPGKIEKKWQKIWQKEQIYEPDIKGDRTSTLRRAQGRKAAPFYNLMMFPYPSAEGLHVGNAYAFIGSDIYGRFQRMRGNDVFEPIGLDGFGIHSENYALKIGVHPAKQAKISEKRFYKQLESLGNGFAWDERLETYDPAYYKWTQWIFIQLFKRGLAYRKKQPVNWCPSCKTVLADEQVLQRQRANGKGQMVTTGICERCETKVIKKDLEQWFFKITDYAEKLLKNIDGLDWSEKVKIAQRNWIGKSEGAEIDFEIKTKEKPNFVLLHGYGGFPDKGFFPWLKRELEKNGHNVQTPLLPHSDRSKISEKDDMNAFWKKVKLDKNTILIGHSLGAVIAMKAVENEKLKQPIRKLILIGGFMKPIFMDKPRPFEKTFDWKFNFKKIKNNSGSIFILHDVNDEIVSRERAAELGKELKVDVTYFSAKGMHVTAKVEPEVLKHCIDNLAVFTTRPDTLFGATYMVLAPEHPLVASLLAADSRGLYADLRGMLKNKSEVKNYVEKAKKKSDEERIAEGQGKTGVELKGIKAVNPANGKEIPVWVADYVLTGYGTGAIMAVPAHDERDYEFAKKYKLPIVQVVEPEFYQTTEPGIVKEGLPFEHRDAIIAIVRHWAEDKYVALKWNKVKWGTFVTGGIEKGQTPEQAAKMEIREETGYLNQKLVADFGVIHGKFYHVPKKVNRAAHAHTLYFQLKNGEREKVAQGELDNHEVLWLTRKELHEFLTPDSHLRALEILEGKKVYAGSGVMTNSGEFDGMNSEEAKWKIAEFVGGERKTQYRLRDWLISRQRYWGPPIPLVFCEECKKRAQNYADYTQTDAEKLPRKSAFSQRKSAFSKGELENPGWIAVPENKLPVKLPLVKDFRPKGTGQSPLATVKSFYETKCPRCGGKARRETDVSDTFLDSSWYFLRYPSVKCQMSNVKCPLDREITRKWLPVDMYIGGAEHSVLHLLYSRFITMFFNDMKLVDFNEPFSKFRAHGLLIKEGGKMSKSKGNVVNPDEYIKNFGADTLRMYLMFLAPFEYGGDFRDAGIMGTKRFLERVWRLYTDANLQMNANAANGESKELTQLTHQTIKKVTEDIENLRYNTAISALMILLNKLEEHKSQLSVVNCQLFLKLLAPFAPHISEELWQGLRESARKNGDSRNFAKKSSRRFASIHLERWPDYDEKLVKTDTFTLVIQINGKVRDTVEAPAGINKEEAEKLALKREKIENIIGASPTKKVIYVPSRLINIVV